MNDNATTTVIKELTIKEIDEISLEIAWKEDQLLDGLQEFSIPVALFISKATGVSCADLAEIAPTQFKNLVDEVVSVNSHLFSMIREGRIPVELKHLVAHTAVQ